MRTPNFWLLFLCGSLTLAGCEQLGIPDPAKEAARLEAEGKAIGSACRHSGRALEDCFALNPAADKSAIFNGWRDMNDYMQQNKLESVRPELAPAHQSAKPAAASTSHAEEKPTQSTSSPATAEPSSPSAASLAAARRERRLRLLPNQGKPAEH